MPPRQLGTWCDYMTSLEHILPGITNIRYAFATRQGKGVQGEKELPCCTLSTIGANLRCRLPPLKTNPPSPSASEGQVGVSVRLRSGLRPPGVLLRPFFWFFRRVCGAGSRKENYKEFLNSSVSKTSCDSADAVTKEYA